MHQETQLVTEEAAASSLVPPLKWAGGKRWLVPTLKPLWEPYKERRLVEPFAGGLAVTLRLNPKKALINDFNAHLINFYRHLQAGLVCDVDSANTSANYYANREAFNELVRKGQAVGDGPEARKAAMLFYYLNRHCFNGICRFNGSGEFNTPVGRYETPKYQADLRPYAVPLADWEFTCTDFEDVPIQKDDFVYADPPYDNAWDTYLAKGFPRKDQKRLAKWLADHDGPVVISNNATRAMVKIYRDLGYDVSRREWAPRMIKHEGKPVPVREVIATKNIDTSSVVVGT